MITDFIFSAEGFSFLRKFKEKFDCSFRISEPSGNEVILDVGDKSYSIKDDESIECFKEAINESMRSGKNILIEKYKKNEVVYDDDVIY